MRLVAFSDLHLDAPFAAAGPTLARHRRDALRRTLRSICELTRSIGADALVSAGDLFEHDRITPDTVAFMQRCFESVAPTPVVLAPGNHDWFGASSVYATTRWSDNVLVATSDRFEPVLTLDGFTIWAAAHRAPSGTANLLEQAPISDAGRHIAVFHGSELSELAAQNDPDKAPHAPFRATDISAAGFEHAIVGHYHRRREAPAHTYPGNPAPLSFGDGGDGGAVVFESDRAGAWSRTWHRVSALESHDLEIDVTGAGDASAIVERFERAAAGRGGIARVTLRGELAPAVAIDEEVIRGARHDFDGLAVRMAGLRVGYDLDAVRDEPTVRGQFVRDVIAAGLEPDEERRVLVTGLRALDGRADLEVV